MTEEKVLITNDPIDLKQKVIQKKKDSQIEEESNDI